MAKTDDQTGGRSTTAQGRPRRHCDCLETRYRPRECVSRTAELTLKRNVDGSFLLTGFVPTLIFELRVVLSPWRGTMGAVRSDTATKPRSSSTVHRSDLRP